MRAGLENNMVKRGLAALLLSGLLLIAGATGAAADGYGSTPPASNYGSTYPTPSTPPGSGDNFSSPPPVLPRTGSNTAGLLGVGAGALLLGGGLVVAARRRKAGVVTA